MKMGQADIIFPLYVTSIHFVQSREKSHEVNVHKIHKFDDSIYASYLVCPEAPELLSRCGDLVASSNYPRIKAILSMQGTDKPFGKSAKNLAACVIANTKHNKSNAKQV